MADQLQVGAGVRRRDRPRRGFCIGCGYYHAVHQAHRADCTATPTNGGTDA